MLHVIPSQVPKIPTPSLSPIPHVHCWQHSEPVGIVKVWKEMVSVSVDSKDEYNISKACIIHSHFNPVLHHVSFLLNNLIHFILFLIPGEIIVNFLDPLLLIVECQMSSYSCRLSVITMLWCVSIQNSSKHLGQLRLY